MTKTTIYTRDFILLIIATFLFFSSFYLIMPVLPLYVKEQGGSTIEVGLVVGAFALSSTIFQTGGHCGQQESLVYCGEKR